MRWYICIAVAMFLGMPWGLAKAEGPYLATGIRIGEVTQDSAIVWVRLTRSAERVPFGGPMPEVRYQDESGEFVKEVKDRDPHLTPVVTFPTPEGAEQPVGVDELEGAVPGVGGKVQLRYRVAGSTEWQETAWTAVDPEADFTHQFLLKKLRRGSRYELEVAGRSVEGTPGATMTGGFKTAPAAGELADVSFVVITCQRYPHRDSPEGFKIYDQMLKLDPDFLVHTGDIFYYDELGKTLDLARWHWQRMYSMPTNVRFHQQVSSYFMKDDHDTWVNDCWPGMESKYMGSFTFEQGRKLFLEQVPMGEKTYRTVRWGKDLQVWFVEGRDYRSPNNMEDGPGKTIWGKEQMEWFKRTVKESDATFRVVISPTPIVGPDRSRKNDNHANEGFTHEGDKIRNFLASQPGMFTVCGDRHWQYVSRDAKTGVREFSCGPASNEHASGWNENDRRPEHEYLNVTGGFLTLSTHRDNDQPSLVARHYSVDGAVLNEVVMGEDRPVSEPKAEPQRVYRPKGILPTR